MCAKRLARVTAHLLFAHAAELEAHNLTVSCAKRDVRARSALNAQALLGERHKAFLRQVVVEGAWLPPSALDPVSRRHLDDM